jgi:hypothetical protein
MLAVPAGTPTGIKKLTWLSETKKSGASSPLILTVVPAKAVGKIALVATSVRVASLAPKPEAMESGATALAKLAADTTETRAACALRPATPTTGAGFSNRDNANKAKTAKPKILNLQRKCAVVRHSNKELIWVFCDMAYLTTGKLK